MKRYTYLLFSLSIFITSCVSGSNNITSANPVSYKANCRTQNYTQMATATQNFMMVGSFGTINQYTTSNNQYKSILYSKTGISGIAVNSSGKFVAVGGSGAILISNDGESWNAANSGISDLSLNGIAVNSNNQFIAVGFNGVIILSAGFK